MNDRQTGKIYKINLYNNCQERPLPGAATPEATARSRAISDDDPEISGAEAITVPGVPRRRGGRPAPRARKSVVSGKSVSVRVDLGGRRIIKKQTSTTNH